MRVPISEHDETPIIEINGCPQDSFGGGQGWTPRAHAIKPGDTIRLEGEPAFRRVTSVAPDYIEVE